METLTRRHPDWIKAPHPSGEEYFRTRAIIKEHGLNTICEEAACPNIRECWQHRTATFLILGDVCTRSCTFCNVATGHPTSVDRDEPERLARAVDELGLEHVVVTSVDRDDLPDLGAEQFVRTARAIKQRRPSCRVEVLTPDFRGERSAVAMVVAAPIDIFDHNVETVPRLYRSVRPSARYEWSVGILRLAKELAPELLTKSGIMVGLGETLDEVLQVARDLRAANVDIMTIGQYLQPTPEHHEVVRYVRPEEFVELKRACEAMGFGHVESGPLVRSSYHAWEHVPASAAPLA